jgi:hypothetical protein
MHSRALTLGAGVDAGMLIADYAFLAETQEQLGNVHRLALSIRIAQLLQRLQ